MCIPDVELRELRPALPEPQLDVGRRVVVVDDSVAFRCPSVDAHKIEVWAGVVGMGLDENALHDAEIVGAVNRIIIERVPPFRKHRDLPVCGPFAQPEPVERQLESIRRDSILCSGLGGASSCGIGAQPGRDVRVEKRRRGGAVCPGNGKANGDALIVDGRERRVGRGEIKLAGSAVRLPRAVCLAVRVRILEALGPELLAAGHAAGRGGAGDAVVERQHRRIIRAVRGCEASAGDEAAARGAVTEVIALMRGRGEQAGLERGAGPKQSIVRFPHLARFRLCVAPLAVVVLGVDAVASPQLGNAVDPLARPTRCPAFVLAASGAALVVEAAHPRLAAVAAVLDGCAPVVIAVSEVGAGLLVESESEGILGEIRGTGNLALADRLSRLDGAGFCCVAGQQGDEQVGARAVIRPTHLAAVEAVGAADPVVEVAFRQHIHRREQVAPSRLSRIVAQAQAEFVGSVSVPALDVA